LTVADSLLVIGGSDAGVSAALAARQADPSLRVTLVLMDQYPNFSVCGLPFLLSGEVMDWRALAHRTADDIQDAGVRLVMDTRVEQIDTAGHVAYTLGPRGHDRMPYDRVVVATGAEPIRPPLGGALSADEGPFYLHSMDDGLRVLRFLEDRRPRRAVVIGAGYIGLEMADALTRRGLAVTVVERSGSVLSTVDPAFAVPLQRHLEDHGVEVRTGTAVERVEAAGARGLLVSAPEFSCAGDLVLVAVGVRPVADLYRAAGGTLGPRGAIPVSPAMTTALVDVYAAGDCVETRHVLLDGPAYLPLGTTAHKQGRVAGINAAGGKAEFHGSVGTQVVKVFDLAVARTGLTEREAAAAGYRPFTVQTDALDHKAYYPGSSRLAIRITGDAESGALLGAAVLGPWRAGVPGRINLFAGAISRRERVADLMDLDLAYTPPLGSPWDAVQMAAEAWLASARARA
jgi:NADPH-dependent 2,4-dienoyl-CoA reductase/sulfur reductase-like enzyme